MDRLERVRFGLPRRASLKHRTWIRALFDRSQSDTESLAVGCIRLVFRLVGEVESSAHRRAFVGFSPGSQIRGAVKRNRVKRLLRECYRLEQGILLRTIADRSDTVTLMVIFRGKDPMPMAQVREDTRRSIALLVAHLCT